MNITIDKEFKALIPPLSAEGFSRLESLCVEHGIQDSLKTWNGILIDGHNRFEIAQKHGLEFKTEEMEFSGRDDVKLWIINNQLGRRNLDKWERFDLAKSLEAIERNLAKQVSLSNLKNNFNDVPKLAHRENGKTRDKMAEKVGVSHGTYDKMKAIDESDNEEVKQKVRNKDMSIDKAYREVRGLPPKAKNPIPVTETAEEPLPFEEETVEFIETEESQEEVEDVANDVSNTFANSLMDTLKTNMLNITGMDHFYRADVLAEVKKLDAADSEKEEFKKQIGECIKYLVHFQNGLMDW